jgi:hypothetical protein
VTAPLAPAIPTETDDDIRTIVTRLSRPVPSGGAVIERAAIVAEGAGSEAIIRWILDHEGQPEIAPSSPTRGLHGTRLNDGAGVQRRPARYFMPAGELS